MNKNTSYLNEFETLFVNNRGLDKIRAHLNRFNPIKTMGMARMEIRHSAILGWLLDPQETHGLGDSFLKGFLAEALRRHSDPRQPTALDVSQADMTDAEIRREWQSIDLLVLSPDNGWIFIIENKFDSKQHSAQLKRYREVVEEALLDGKTYKTVRGIFLTLWDENAQDESYAPIKYSDICDLLEQLVFSGRLPLTAEVETFLKHYWDVIMEATGMSKEQKEMEDLARQLYKDHRRALDFIIEHGKSTDFLIACDEVFGPNLNYPDEVKAGEQELVFHKSTANTFSFLPKAWFDAFGGGKLKWPGCEDWWAGFPVITWLQLESDANGGGGQIRLYAEVGPLRDYKFRRELIEAIDKKAASNLPKIGFQRGATDQGKRYSRFFKKNSLKVDDVHNPDIISKEIEKILASFKDEIAKISEVFPAFLSNGEEKHHND